MSIIQASSCCLNYSCNYMITSGHKRGSTTRASTNVPKLFVVDGTGLGPDPLPRHSHSHPLKLLTVSREWVGTEATPNPLPSATLFEVKKLKEEKELISSVYLSKKKQESDKLSPNEDPLVIAKLYEIMEAISDRVEMHKNIGEQRNNWNSLLLTSINGLILGAATMAAIISATSAVDFPVLALKLSSMTMYLAATGMLIVMNKIQPSQLAEEQRNSARLFQNLGFQVEKLISIGYPTDDDVRDMMERVLALDKAYPLPLLGAMLDKFPCKTEPAVWWPTPRPPREKEVAAGKKEYNGWNKNLEVEMREIMGQVRKNDMQDYLRLGNKALKLNKILAISGPMLTTLAAIGTVFVDSSSHGGLLAAAMLGIVGGALAAAVNGFEHGGQVGMVFELYRSNAGFFKFVEESIEKNLEESDVGKRENGELFEMKVALQLGRSPKELKDLTTSSFRNEGEIDEFASKLF